MGIGDSVSQRIVVPLMLGFYCVTGRMLGQFNVLLDKVVANPPLALFL